jgi:ribosomal protein S18 acetylase RimI-like enzyme
MTGILVRPAVFGDIESIYAVESTCSYPWTVGDVGRARRQPGGECLVATLFGQVAGYAIHHTYGLREIVLDRIAVHADLRRHGVGSALLRRISWRLGTERTRLVATVPDTSLAAHLFLADRGFQATRVERDAFGRGRDAYRFILFVDVAEAVGTR